MLLGQLIWDLLQSFHALLLPKYHLHEVVNLTVCDKYITDRVTVHILCHYIPKTTLKKKDT